MSAPVIPRIAVHAPTTNIILVFFVRDPGSFVVLRVPVPDRVDVGAGVKCLHKLIVTRFQDGDYTKSGQQQLFIVGRRDPDPSVIDRLCLSELLADDGDTAGGCNFLLGGANLDVADCFLDLNLGIQRCPFICCDLLVSSSVLVRDCRGHLHLS
ncbi:hypothetical protein RQP46_001422 [Phenoliferia psychrophenolica]